MAYKDLNELLSRLSTLLQANLPAELDAQDTLYNDGITLADPLTYRIAPFASVEEIRQLPAVLMLPVATADERATAGVKMQRHTVEISVVILEPDTEVLAKRVMRTLRAIDRVLSEKVSGDRSSFVLAHQVRVIDYGTPLEMGSSRMVQIGTLEALLVGYAEEPMP